MPPKQAGAAKAYLCMQDRHREACAMLCSLAYLVVFTCCLASTAECHDMQPAKHVLSMLHALHHPPIRHSTVIAKHPEAARGSTNSARKEHCTTE